MPEVEEKKEVVEEKKEEILEEKKEEKGEGKEPTYDELKNMMADLKTKFVPKEVVDTLRTELDGVKGATEVVDRIRKAISGDKVDDGQTEAEKAAFYKLLINNPVEAIRKVVAEEQAKTAAATREIETEKSFKRFAIQFPEYKKYEEDMKAELLANPGWFGRPNFIQRVFFDVLSFRDPKLLAEIVASGRVMNTEGEFIYEGSSQSDHSAVPSGADVLNRMKSAGGKTKSFFE